MEETTDKKKERLAFIAAYPGDVLLTVQEAKMVLGIGSDNYIYELINCGLLDFLIIGSKKIRKSTLDKFLKDYEGVDITELIRTKKGESN